jgi:hypothetical protein
MTTITQLFHHLELLSEGDPPRHSLFVLGQEQNLPDQLLLIDPPPDVANRFNLPQQVAAVFTGPAQEVGVPLMEGQVGGVAHVRVGQHLLDIYADAFSTVIHFPAMGIVCGGQFGSDLVLPAISAGSDGSEVLETLRLLARLLRQHRLQIYIPHIGSPTAERVEAMGRLAADVSYLQGLQRIIPAAAKRGEDLASVRSLARSLLPANRRTALCREVHEQNVEQLYHQANMLP